MYISYCSLATAWCAGVVSGDVWCFGEEMEKHRPGWSHKPVVPGSDERLRQMLGSEFMFLTTRNKKICWNHIGKVNMRVSWHLCLRHGLFNRDASFVKMSKFALYLSQCGYESARNDSYLDIPLVIRPFGSNQAYGSVVRDFVSLHVFSGLGFHKIAFALLTGIKKSVESNGKFSSYLKTLQSVVLGDKYLFLFGVW